MSPLARSRPIGVTVGLTAAEAKHVRRQVLAQEPVEKNHIEVLRGAAVQLREGLAKQLLWWPGFLILFAGQSLARGIQSVIDVVIIVVLLVLLVLLGHAGRQFHQTGVFLDSTDPAGSDHPT